MWLKWFIWMDNVTKFACRWFSDITKDNETRFDTWNYELYSPLPKGKTAKVTWLMKDELGGKIMTSFATLRPKLYNHFIDDDVDDKKAKDAKKFVIK